MYHIFDRVGMKRRAKNSLRRNYCRGFLVSLFTALLLGSAGTAAGGGLNFNFNFDVTELFSADNSYTDPFFGFSPFNNMAPDHGAMINVALVFLGIALVVGLISFLISFARLIYVGNVMWVGNCRYYINCTRGEEKFSDLTSAFGVKGKVGYFNAVKVLFKRELILFLYDLPLFIGVLLFLGNAILGAMGVITSMTVGGIGLLIACPIILVGMVLSIVKEVKRYELSMLPFLLAEFPEMTTREAFVASKELTNGHKWDLFVMDLSFLGWQILGVLCLGIGTYFLLPYIDATWGEAYAALCVENAARQYVPAAPAAPAPEAPAAPAPEAPVPETPAAPAPEAPEVEIPEVNAPEAPETEIPEVDDTATAEETGE